MQRQPLTKNEANQARRKAIARRDERGDQTTLDMFAAQALSGILSTYSTWQGDNGELNVRKIAKKAYDLASEMMFQRSIRDTIGVVAEDAAEEDED